MKRLLILIAAFCLSAGLLSAQNTWEGSAAMGRYGEFPPTGLYAASNSFPRNSIVEVKNLRNGKTARVIIAKDLSDPGLFMVLSEEAARELELGRADVANVRISPVFTPGAETGAAARDLPFSQDPDVNPRARLADTNTVLNAREVPGRVPAAPRPEAVPLPLRPDVSPDAAGEVPAPKSLPTVDPEKKPEAPMKQPPPASVPTPAVSLAPTAVIPAEKPAAPVETGPEAPLAAPAAAAAVEPPSPNAPEPQPLEQAVAQAAPGIKTAPETKLEAMPETKPVEVEEDWARSSVSNALDESLDLAASRSPQKALFPPPREEDQLAFEQPKAPATTTAAITQKLPEATPEPEAKPIEKSMETAKPPVLAFEAPLAIARPAAESIDIQPDLVFPEERPPLVTFFNDVERLADEPSLAREEKPAPGMERPAGVQTVLSLEPAELRPPAQPRPDDYFTAPLEPTGTALALALDEPMPDQALPGSIGPVAAVAEPLKQVTPGVPVAPALQAPAAEPETGTLKKLETIIASLPPKQEAALPVKPVEVKPGVPERKPAAGDGGLPIVSQLEKNAIYLQLGVYSNPQSARGVLSNLGPAYPVAVLAAGGDKPLYRVFVGPVREDEKGGLLHVLRARGFKDVFVRKGS